MKWINKIQIQIYFTGLVVIVDAESEPEPDNTSDDVQCPVTRLQSALLCKVIATAMCVWGRAAVQSSLSSCEHRLGRDTRHTGCL